jgi:hypothetical protein
LRFAKAFSINSTASDVFRFARKPERACGALINKVGIDADADYFLQQLPGLFVAVLL